MSAEGNALNSANLADGKIFKEVFHEHVFYRETSQYLISAQHYKVSVFIVFIIIINIK